MDAPERPKRKPSWPAAAQEARWLGIAAVVLGLGMLIYHWSEYASARAPGIDEVDWEKKMDRWETDRIRRMLLAFVGIGIAAFGGFQLVRNAPTLELSGRVVRLNPLRGKTSDEVRRELGRPHVVEHTEDGRTLETWNSPGYSVTLAFRDRVCEGVVREVTA